MISAQLGSVVLAAGSVMTMDVAGDGLLNIAVTEGAVDALVENGGLIRADGGQVLLTTQAAGSLLQNAVNNTGVIQAQSLVTGENGSIMLMGGMETGTVSVSGTLDASGTGAGLTGGSVTATGHHVGLFGANINASGDAGGGTVLVGGDYQGKNPLVQNATATYISADSTISVDAISNGNGGTAILWSDGSTRASGSISARGGALGGDGGLIETSGHWLDVAGSNVSASAPNGKNGTWLLDPANVIISGAATSGATLTGSVFAPDPNVNDAIVNAGDLQATLNGGTDVTITTTNTGGAGGAGTGIGDITVGAALTWTTANALTLNAANDVIVNFAVTATSATGNSSIILIAGNDVRLNTNGGLNTGMTASSANSAIRMTAVNNVIVDVPVTASAMDTVINMSAGNNVTSTSTITASGLRAKIDMIAAGNGNVDANIVTANGGGSMNLRANNNVTVRGALTADTATAPVVSPVILIADNDGTGPGIAAGTVIFAGAGIQSITPSTTIRFNPNGYNLTNAEIVAYQAKVSALLDGKAWVFGLGDNKMYDGTRTATVSGLEPDISAANPAVTGVLAPVTNALFDTKHVGTNKLITFDSAFADPFYQLFAPFGTPAGSYTTRADITVRPLTVSAVTDTRVYNGTTSSVGVPTVTGLQVGDVPIDTLNGPLTQAYASKDVMGTMGSTLVATGPYTVADGNGGNNYIVTVNTAPGTITPLALVGSITANNKMYDANNSAVIASRTLATPIAGDTVSYIGGTAVFSDENVANGKTVTGTGLSLAGADAGNYTVNTTAVTTANITPAPLTITANDASKVYGQTATLAPTAFTTTALVAGETVGTVTEVSPEGTPATAAVPGPYAIIPSAATGGTFTPGNYTITYVNGALTVTPAPLTIKANDNTKVYGTTFTPASTAFTTPVAPQNGETVGSVTETSPEGTPATAGVPGPYAIIPSAATGGTFTPGNYTITYVNGALTVTPVPLTVTANDATKTYGQTVVLPDTAFTTTGLVNGDTVTSVPVTSAGTLALAPVGGSPYAITPGTATGTYVPGNYTVTYVDGKLYVLPVVVVPPVFLPPVVTPDVGPNPWPPAVVLPLIPQQLQTLAPPVVLAPPPVPMVLTPPPERVAPVVQPVPQPYVAPIRPRKQDRN
jgi:hypothetical protein